jgi:hypothetical protein
MFVLSAPVGIFFGLVTWAALRGKGGFFGLILFALFGTLGAFLGVLAVDAIGGAVSDRWTGLGVAVGAALASLAGVIGFGSRPLVSRAR